MRRSNKEYKCSSYGNRTLEIAQTEGLSNTEMHCIHWTQDPEATPDTGYRRRLKPQLRRIQSSKRMP